MKKVINEEDIRRATNIERCKILLAIIRRTGNVHTRHKDTLSKDYE